jgi:hypothetical protein
MTIVLTPTDEHKVSTHDGLWMSAADAERVTGWALKPEGMCRNERCVPLPPAAVKGGDVDVEAFWEKLGGPVIASQDGDAWALGLEAPDFTLPDVDGKLRSLSELRGKKVFLATWASW